MHIDAAAMGLPAAEPCAAKSVDARTTHGLMRVDHARMETRQRRDDLEGRARWILASDSAILQRLILCPRDLRPSRRIDFEHDLVGVEGWRGGERKNSACDDVEYNDRGDPMLLQPVLCDALKMMVEAENEVLAAHARRRA